MPRAIDVGDLDEEDLDSLIAEADELYALTPAEFTAARDARAAELKVDYPDFAPYVKALRKPSTGAWVVNQLVRRETAAVQDLLGVGSALREAQAALSAEQLREFTKQRRQLTASVTTLGRNLGRDLGTRLTEAVADQVEQTLTAAMLDAGAEAAVRTGLLVTVLRPAGVDAVDIAAALAVPGSEGFEATEVDRDATGSGIGDAVEADERVAPVVRLFPSADDSEENDNSDGEGPDAAARAEAEARAAEAARAAEEARRRKEEARARLVAADDALAAAEEELAELDEEVTDLEARGRQAQARLEELRTKLAEATERQTRVEDQLVETEEARETQRAAVEAAQSARDDAAAELRRLDES